MSASDVRRACVRGVVIGGASAALLPVGVFVYQNSHVRLDTWGVSFRLDDVTPVQAALFGLFTGLLAAPLALIELRRAAKPRSPENDYPTAALIGLLAALLLVLASLQAIYTGSILEKHSFSAAAAAVVAQMNSDDSVGYALFCLVAGVPVATTALLRIQGRGFVAQMVASVVLTFLLRTPVLAFIESDRKYSVPVDPLTWWLVGAALLLGPLASLSDRIAARFDDEPGH